MLRLVDAVAKQTNPNFDDGHLHLHIRNVHLGTVCAHLAFNALESAPVALATGRRVHPGQHRLLYRVPFRRIVARGCLEGRHDFAVDCRS